MQFILVVRLVRKSAEDSHIVKISANFKSTNTFTKSISECFTKQDYHVHFLKFL